MEIRKYGLRKVLVAEENKHIRRIDDVYVPAHEEDGKIIPAHFPYYTSILFLGDNFEDDKLDELYIEEEIEEN